MIKYICSLFFLFVCWLGSTQSYAQSWIEVNSSLGSVTEIDEVNGTLYTISNTGLFGVLDKDSEIWEIKDISHTISLQNGIPTSICFIDKNNGFVAVRDQLFGNQLQVTQDGGTSWAASDFLLDSECPGLFIPMSLFKNGENTLILDRHQNGNFLISDDRGQNWRCTSQFSDSESFQIIETLSDSIWYTHDSRGFYKTSDAGSTWALIFQRRFSHFQMTDDRVIYGLRPAFYDIDNIPMLYFSNNEFQSFDSISLKQFKSEFIDLFVVTASNDIYIIVDGTDIFRSNNNGSSFELIQKLPKQVFKTRFLNDSWYLFGRGLWKLDASVTSYSEVEEEKNSLVYPNPFQQSLSLPSINFESYTIYSIKGELIESGIINTKSLDMNHLNPGTYLLELRNKNKSSIQKVVKL